jgi:hypothetical protein
MNTNVPKLAQEQMSNANDSGNEAKMERGSGREKLPEDVKVNMECPPAGRFNKKESKERFNCSMSIALLKFAPRAHPFMEKPTRKIPSNRVLSRRS